MSWPTSERRCSGQASRHRLQHGVQLLPPAFQDAARQLFKVEQLARWYGCGANNDHGHHIKIYWDGDESVRFTPEPHDTVEPGYRLKKLT